MASMLNLTIENDYTLEYGVLLEAIDYGEGVMRDCLLMQPMAQPDGELLISAIFYFDDQESKQVLIRLSGKTVSCRDLEPLLSANPRGKFHPRNWMPVALPTGVLYVQNTEQAVFIPTDTNIPYEPFTISNHIEDNQLKATFQVSRYAHLIASDSKVAVPLETGDSATWLATLSVDTNQKTATWERWITDDTVQQESSFLKKLFSKPTNSKAKPLTEDQLITLTPSDFHSCKSVPSMNKNYSYVINQSLIRKNHLLVFTWGSSDSPKYGYQCAAIADIDQNGRVQSLPFIEDFTCLTDEKKRGIRCRFTSDGHYAILTPVYQSTDPWGGKQGIFKLATKELFLACMPRGFSKFRIIDINAGCIWAEFRNPENKVLRIAVLKAY